MNKTRCVHCGKEIEYYRFECPTLCDECINNYVTIKIDTNKPEERGIIGVQCLICGESVPLNELEAQQKHIYKICDKCKKAVMKMRGDK